ncbi:MAG TPA: hypothetical protein PLH57_07990 [Oligoflexia bacterium]|nr:hypothetical protein [Oligoflexia bacterium]
MNRRLFSFWLVTASISLVAVSHGALADGRIKKGNKVTHRSRSSGPDEKNFCHATDPRCINTLLRLLSGASLPVVETTVGYSSDSTASDSSVTGGVTVEAGSIEMPIGDASLGRFEALFLSRDRGVRLRLTLGESNVMFECKTREGKTNIPGLGRMNHFCQPRRNKGVGGKLLELQYDPKKGRFAGRWAQFNAVLDLLGSSHSQTYLQRQLNLSAGLDAESIWHGDGSDSDHFSRLQLGLAGLVRSADARWEASAQIGYRPVVFGTLDALTDYGLTSEGALVYNFLKNESAVVSTGLQFNAEYWSNPESSLGVLSSIEDRTSIYIGAVLGVRYEYSRF